MIKTKNNSKPIVQQAWFVPLVIGLVIVLTLVVFRYKDDWFGDSDNGHINKVGATTAVEYIQDMEDKNGDTTFVIVYSSDACGFCNDLYTTLKSYQKSDKDLDNGYYSFWIVDIDNESSADARSLASEFGGAKGYNWDGSSTDDIASSGVSNTPTSLVIKDGQIEGAIIGAPSSASRMSIMLDSM